MSVAHHILVSRGTVIPQAFLLLDRPQPATQKSGHAGHLLPTCRVADSFKNAITLAGLRYSSAGASRSCICTRTG